MSIKSDKALKAEHRLKKEIKIEVITCWKSDSLKKTKPPRWLLVTVCAVSCQRADEPRSGEGRETQASDVCLSSHPSSIQTGRHSEMFNVHIER